MTFVGRNDGGARLYGALGNDPSMEEFGANRMQAESVDRTRYNPIDLTNEHGSYDDPNSESLYNIAAVVAGDRIWPSPPSHASTSRSSRRTPRSRSGVGASVFR